LDYRELTLSCFYEDGKEFQASNRALEKIMSSFGDRIISKDFGLPSLQRDFILWGLLKIKCLKPNLSCWRPKKKYYSKTAAIPPVILAATLANLERRVGLCLQVEDLYHL
jgi:hypothetical protein